MNDDERDDDPRVNPDPSTPHEDPESAEQDTVSGDESRLGARLSYLLMLMRRGEARRRHGEHRAGGRHGQGRVLRLLSLHSPVAQKELAYLLGIRSQSLAEQIGKLEEAGLVERRPNPQDRRSSVVELTEQGREAAEEVIAQPAEDFFEALDAQEKEQLAGLLDKVIEEMESGLPGGPDPRMQMFKQRVYSAEGGFGPGFGGGPRGRFGGGGFGGGGFGRGRSGGGPRDGFEDEPRGSFDGDPRGGYGGGFRGGPEARFGGGPGQRFMGGPGDGLGDGFGGGPGDGFEGPGRGHGGRGRGRGGCC